MRRTFVLAVGLVLLADGRAFCQQPKTGGKPSGGLKPLTEMSATDRYKGEDGGLYGGGKNEPPPAHAAAARKEIEQIVPLDADGKPAPDGVIALA